MPQNSVGQIFLDLGINSKEAQKELNGIAKTAENQMKSAFKGLAKVMIAAFSVTQLVKFGKSAISLASSLQEVSNVISVTFGAMSDDINKWAMGALSSFGLAELSAKRYVSFLGSMIKTSGVTADKTALMSKNLAGFSGDLASFFDLNPEEAFGKIQSAMAGEIKPLRDLGINMSVANLEAYALSKGITESFEKMSEANRTILRYNFLMEKTVDIQGDFMRTQSSWANQTKILSEQWNKFKATMGQAFIVVLTPMIRVLNEIIAKLQEASIQFRNFIDLLFNVSRNEPDKAMESLGDSATETGDAVAAAAKKVKQSLSAFDELNVIGQSSDSSSGSTGSTLPTMDIVDSGAGEAPKALSGLSGALSELVKPLKEINLSPLVDSLFLIKDALAPLTKTVFGGLYWAFTNIFVPLSSFTIEDVIPRFLGLISIILGILNPLLEGFAPLALLFWENFLSPIATFVGDSFLVFLDLLVIGLTGFSDWAVEYMPLIVGWTGTIATFFAAWQVIKLLAFIQMSGGLIEAFKLITTAIALNTGALLVNLGTWALAKIETMALTAMYAIDFVAGIGKATAAIAVNATETLYLAGLYAKDMVISIGKSLVSMGVAIIEWGSLTVALVANKVAMLASTVQNGILTASIWVYNAGITAGTIATSAFTAVLAVLTSPITLVIAAIVGLIAIIVALVKNWDKVKEVSANVWEGIKNVWSGVSTWFEMNIVNPIANMFIGLINGINSGFNVMIRGLNKINIRVPNWVPGLGGESVGFNISELGMIPKLAKGGMVSAPTLAMVGDNRNAAVDPEVVSPLSKLQGMMTGSNQVMVEVLFQILAAIQELDPSIELDGEKLARLLRGYTDDEDNRLGKKTVQIGGQFA